MPVHSGYLLIADISGYTGFLTSSELEHANPILRELLSALVDQVGDPLHLWRLDGDAVLAYTTAQGFPDGDTFLTLCDNLYRAFADHRQAIIANTTCTCQACANVSTLDLKILVHHGQFEEMSIGPMKDISGADVILVHRMSKSDVKVVTGIHSYALFSQAAVDAMGIQNELVPFSATFEHFGEVAMRVYDLAESWARYRANQERQFLTEAEGVVTVRHRFDAPIPVVWQLLTEPTAKRTWLGMRSSTATHSQGRQTTGTQWHCVHTLAEFTYWVTDWHPFEYFSTRILDPLHPGLENRETYAIEPADDGSVVVRYTMGPLTDSEGVHHPIEQVQIAAIYQDVFEQGFKRMETLLPGAGEAV